MDCDARHGSGARLPSHSCTTDLPSHGTRPRLARLLLCALAALAWATPAAHASVQLTSAIATGIAPASYPAGANTAGNNRYCTAEPRTLFDGTQSYDPTKALSWFGTKVPGQTGYVPANLPAAADLTPATTAGSHSDFCVGFSLTPNADPAIIRTTTKSSGSRIQPTPPVADDPDTRVADNSGSPVEGDDMDRIVIDLPAGYVGSLAAVPTCSADRGGFGQSDWTVANCPANTQLGDAFVRVHGFISGFLRAHVIAENSQIYNLTHGPDEIGILGVQVQPFDGVAPVKFTVRLTLSPDGSGRIRTIVEGAPTFALDLDDVGSVGDTWRDGSGDILAAGDARIGQPQPDANPDPLYVESVGFRIWGSRADHPTMPGDFGELPTQCDDDISAHVSVTTYGGTTSSADTAPIRLDGCDALDFRPSVDVTTSQHRPGVPTGVTVGVNLAQNATGRTTSLLKDATIRLPAGLELGAQVASVEGGLRLCRADEFDFADQLTPSTCKDGSAVGTVTITSPLIDYPFVGTVYLGEQRAVGDLPDLYVEASPENAFAPDAPRIKLVGRVSADRTTGQITTAFLNNPQLRFNRIEFNFPEGPTSFFTTPERCGTYAGDSVFVPWSGGAVVRQPSTIAIDQDCGLPAGGTVAVSSANPTAGARSQTRITVDRPDRGAWLTHLGVSLPTGLLADMNVPTECAAAQADAGNCPQSSRLGTVTALAGAGDQPWSLAGAMYLTSRVEGDVAGSVIVVRAAVGDLDLGNVIVRGHIRLRPTDAGLDFEADIPTRFQGVALQLRRVIVDLDRAGLMLNPTACGPVTYRSAITVDDGAITTAANSLAFTGCKQLPFSPTLQAQIIGDNRPGGHPGMYVRLDSPLGDAALKRAAVTLPDGVAVDLDNVQNPCPREDFDALRCPASARVGSVTAFVSITPEPITGDIYLIKVDGKRLPGLGLNFTGRYAQRVVSTVDTDDKQRIVTTFPDIPDLPLRQLIVKVDSTPRSPLQLPKTACAANTSWSGAFTAQGGQTATAKTGLQCAAKPKVTLSDRRGLSLRLFDFGGRKLKAMKVTLPDGWRIDRTRARRRGDQMWVRMTGGSGKVTVTKASILASTKAKSVTTIRLKVGGLVIRPVTKKAKRAKRGRIRIRMVFTDGTVQVQKPALSLRK